MSNQFRKFNDFYLFLFLNSFALCATLTFKDLFISSSSSFFFLDEQCQEGWLSSKQPKDKGFIYFYTKCYGKFRWISSLEVLKFLSFKSRCLVNFKIFFNFLFLFLLKIMHLFCSLSDVYL